jgi:hypothetical protein
MSKAGRGRGLFALSIIATLVATLAIGILLLFWMQASSADHVLERTRAFHDVMRVVRPAVLLVILLLWRQIFDQLHDRSMVTDRTHERAIAIWPRLTVWGALFELMLGQGYVLLGLVVLAGYLVFQKWQSE